MRIPRNIKKDLFSAISVITSVDDDWLGKGLGGQYDPYSYISVVPSPVVSFVSDFTSSVCLVYFGLVFSLYDTRGNYLLL